MSWALFADIMADFLGLCSITWLLFELFNLPPEVISLDVYQVFADFNGHQVLTTAAVTITMLTCIVSIGRWIYVSSMNVHSATNNRMEVSPGWAVGWYFIPILNLWKPYQAFREIWAESFLREHESAAYTNYLPLCWVLWIITNLVDRILIWFFYLSEEATELSFLKQQCMVETASFILHILLNVVFLILVNRLANCQNFLNFPEKNNKQLTNKRPLRE